MSETNKTIVRQIVEEVQSGHNLDRMEAFFAPDFVNHLDHGGSSDLNSIERAQIVFRQLFAAFPDLHVTILDQVAEADKVVTHKIFKGTHQGTFMGVPATGREISFAVIDILRLKEGKVVEHWAIQDRLAMLQQLGLVSA